MRDVNKLDHCKSDLQVTGTLRLVSDGNVIAYRFDTAGLCLSGFCLTEAQSILYSVLESYGNSLKAVAATARTYKEINASFGIYIFLRIFLNLREASCSFRYLPGSIQEKKTHSFPNLGIHIRPFIQI